MISVQELIQMMEVVQLEECPYLPGKTEKLRVARCPGLPNELHAELMHRGFRHSRDLFYTSECDGCDQCIPMRIDPLLFKPSKKQRHIFNKNSDVVLEVRFPELTEEISDIYRRYMQFQHPNSIQTDPEKSLEALFVKLPSSAEILYRLGSRIIGVTLADILPEKALSSVYHFFDPDFAKRSIGTFSMIAEIQLTALLHIPFFYPGLWVPDCPKMKYKALFRPHQLRIHGEWIEQN